MAVTMINDMQFIVKCHPTYFQEGNVLQIKPTSGIAAGDNPFNE